MENTCEIFNKDGQRAIDAKSIESLTECVFALPQTKTFHLDKNGDYTAERKKLHEEIIKDFKDDVICIDKGKPIAVLMGGSPASGKSTFLKKYRPYLLSDNLFKVDADEIRAKLPEYKGWNATQTHEETGDIVKTLISDKNIGIPCKFDFIYDGTMTSVKKYLALIDLLKSEGYEVFVVFISNIPQADVKQRALERYQKSGRFVPMMVVDDFYKNGEDTFKQVKTQVDGYIVVDGSTFDYNVMEKGGKSLPNKRLYEKLGHKIELKNGGQMRTYKIIYKGNIRIESALSEQAAIEQAKQKLSMFYGNIPDSQLIAIEMEIPSNKFEEGGPIESLKYADSIWDKNGNKFQIVKSTTESYFLKSNLDGNTKEYPKSVFENLLTKNHFMVSTNSSKSDKDPQFIQYDEDEIMFVPFYGTYWINEEEFTTLEQAMSYIDKGYKPKMYYAKGGPIHENFVITATGLSKENKKDLMDMGVQLNLQGPGYYLYVKTSDKEKVINYLEMNEIEFSPQYAKGGPIENTNDPQFIQYNGDEIMFVPVYGTYWVNDEEFETIEQAKSYIDEGYEPKMFAKGGQTESKIIKHFKPSDFYKLGGSIEEMTPVEKFFSQLDYSQLPSGFAEYVNAEILTDPSLEFVSETDPIFVEIKNKVNSIIVVSKESDEIIFNDENAETQEAIDLLLELAEDQEGAEKAETLEAVELLKELLV